MTSVATDSSGYRVTPSALTEAGNELSGQAQQLSTTADQIGSVKLPAQAFGSLPQSAGCARFHNELVEKASQTAKSAQQKLGTVATGLTNSATNYTDGDTKAAAGYRSLLDAARNTNMSARPGAGGGGSANLIAPNQLANEKALTTETAHLRDLEGQLASRRAVDGNNLFGDDYSSRLNIANETELQSEIDASHQKINQYTQAINNGH